MLKEIISEFLLVSDLLLNTGFAEEVKAMLDEDRLGGYLEAEGTLDILNE